MPMTSVVRVQGTLGERRRPGLQCSGPVNPVRSDTPSSIRARRHRHPNGPVTKRKLRRDESRIGTACSGRHVLPPVTGRQRRGFPAPRGRARSGPVERETEPKRGFRGDGMLHRTASRIR